MQILRRAGGMSMEEFLRLQEEIGPFELYDEDVAAFG